LLSWSMGGFSFLFVAEFPQNSTLKESLDFPQNFSFQQDEGEQELIGARLSLLLKHRPPTV